MYEWDEAKRQSNLAKHRVDFTAMADFEWDTAVTSDSPRHGEWRWIARGFIGRVLHSVVYALRGNSVRVISLRKATRKEIEVYAQSQA